MSQDMVWDFKGKNDFRDWDKIKGFVEEFLEKIK
jgi:hypothetical protein